MDPGKHAAHVRRDQAIEVVQAELVDAPQDDDAGVDDHDVEPAEIPDRLLDSGADGVRIGAVGSERHASNSVHGGQVGDGDGLVHGRDVGESDIRSVAGEAEHDGLANPPRAAEHQSDFSRERQSDAHDAVSTKAA